MRLTGIIFAIGLLVSSVVSAQTHSAEWSREKDQSWAKTRIDYPASTITGPFLNRMVEIDRWAKQNNTSLYNDSNKPYLLAQMVQREVDEAKARQTTPTAPPITPSPSARPAVSTLSPQPSSSPALQQIVQSHSQNPDRPAIWLGAAIIVAIASVVAFLFFKIVSPKPGVKTAAALGQRWAAWAGVLATLCSLPAVFQQESVGISIAIWVLMIVLTAPIAFVIGWIIGLFKYRKSTIALHKENPPETVGVNDLKSPPKTVHLTTAKPPPTTVLLTTAKPPPAPMPKPTPSTFMKNTEYDVTVPEGIELENGYVEMRHNTQYSLKLLNHRAIRCDAKVLIDGTHVGTWRIEKNSDIRIERPVHDTGHFTFFTVGTEEARIAGIAKSSENGLISVTFNPEKIREFGALNAADLPDCEQGATGLTGQSKQRFVNADEIEYDTARSFTIHLRLVSARPDIRPLAQRSSPIPPPIG